MEKELAADFVAAPKDLPKPMPPEAPREHDDTLNDRQKAVVNAAKHAWSGYKKYAWGHDHLRPISQSYQDWFHLGLTIVDSLDTLYIMNLKSGTRLLQFRNCR